MVHSSITTDYTRTVQVCCDPKDDRILEVAVNGNDSFLVTGRDDLTHTESVSCNIQVLVPSKLLELIRERPM